MTLAVGLHAGDNEIVALQQAAMLSGEYVSGFGAKGDGTTDDTAALQKAINSVKPGGVLVFGQGLTYKITSALTVASAMTLNLNGSTVSQATSNTGGFAVSSSGVTIINGTVIGPQHAVEKDGEIGIAFNGPSAASPISSCAVRNVSVSNWGIYGIYGTYFTDFEFIGNSISSIFYGGILVISGIRGVISNNQIKDVTGSISGNAYGIALTRNAVASLVTDPPSSDIVVSSNTIKNVPVWEGIDTHAGQRISIVGNTILGCFRGIIATIDGSNAIAPHAIVIADNTLDSGVADGSYDVGIGFNGYSSALGSLVDGATGAISGNYVKGYGNDATLTSGGIYVHSTVGVSCSGNVFDTCSPNGMLPYYDNTGLTISGGAVIDAWTNAQANAIGVNINSNFQQVTVSDVSFVTNGKTATHVGSIGIHAPSSATINVGIGNNYNTYTTYLDIGASVVIDRELGTNGATANFPGGLTCGLATIGVGGNQVVATFYDNASSGKATAGFIRFRVTDAAGWRNNANNANLLLGVNAADVMSWGGKGLIPAASVTVANLPSAGGAGAGAIAYANNGRKSGEGVGAGTGIPTWSDGTNWRTFYDNTITAA